MYTLFVSFFYFHEVTLIFICNFKIEPKGSTFRFDQE